MAIDKYVDDHYDDLSLDGIKQDGDELLICPSKPTDYANAHAIKLAEAALTPEEIDGPKDGPTSGRCITIPQKLMPVDTPGTAACQVVCCSTAPRICIINPCTEQPLVAGTNFLSPEFNHRIPDPV